MGKKKNKFRGRFFFSPCVYVFIIIRLDVRPPRTFPGRRAGHHPRTRRPLSLILSFPPYVFFPPEIRIYAIRTRSVSFFSPRRRTVRNVACARVYASSGRLSARFPRAWRRAPDWSTVATAPACPRSKRSKIICTALHLTDRAATSNGKYIRTGPGTQSDFYIGFPSSAPCRPYP